MKPGPVGGTGAADATAFFPNPSHSAALFLEEPVALLSRNSKLPRHSAQGRACRAKRRPPRGDATSSPALRSAGFCLVLEPNMAFRFIGWACDTLDASHKLLLS